MTRDEQSDDRSAATLDARLEEWAALLDGCSYYELLGVEDRAGEAALKTAYHRFAAAFHPDSHVGAGAAAIASAIRIFQRGTEAYRVLTHPELRVRYDMALSRGRLRLLPSEIPPAPRAGSEGRPLHELCRSAGAKLAAQRAARLIDTGDIAGARRELARALEQDGGSNPEIVERIDALDVILYAMGDDV